MHFIQLLLSLIDCVCSRHHVRFFPRNRNDADKSGNCPAGFVADQGVGNPAVRDFYLQLQSHGGLLGTSRPSHYITLRDDIYKNNTDDLQELVFVPELVEKLLQVLKCIFFIW
ncbi:hypothetical protein DFH29DRAFT_1006504 [Suillus ampliporus]|nr:hypothetical protein DFH29DRAFT_1006504 [Suillus ampliporus]